MSRGNLSRRAALKAIGAGGTAVVVLPWLSESGLLAFSRIQDTKAAAAPKVLSASQFATLEALVEAIIPADAQSAGAREARVADYIDLLLGEVDEPIALQWMGGIAELDDEAAGRFGTTFAKLDAERADAILAAISRNEADPQTPLEAFFVMAKHATIDGYYTSEVGIHRELRYKGNKFLNEFVGCRTEDGKDCPHCGQTPTEIQRRTAGR
jgi:hypothetical protein